jgi:hypothetical protein
MLRLDECMGSAWEKQGMIHIINNSKKIVYVVSDDPLSVTSAVDPGRRVVFPISNDTIRLTLSYYGDTREMEYLCSKQVFNQGRLLRVQARPQLPCYSSRSSAFAAGTSVIKTPCCLSLSTALSRAALSFTMDSSVSSMASCSSLVS